MFLLPWAITFAKPHTDLLLAFTLIYIINPLYSIVMGIMCSRNIRDLWSIPIVCSIMYYLGATIILKLGEKVSILEAIVYMLLGITIMIITKRINNKKHDENGITN